MFQVKKRFVTLLLMGMFLALPIAPRAVDQNQAAPNSCTES
jgi:hypothetical protein